MNRLTALYRFSSEDIQSNVKLQYWQNRVLNSILFTGVILGFVACIPSVWLSLKEHLYNIAFLDIAAYLYLLQLFFNKKLSYEFKAANVCLLCYIMAITLLWTIGPFGAGPVWLFAFPILTGVLLSHHASIAAILLNTATLIIIGLLLHANMVDWSYAVVNSVGKWIVIVFNFILLNTAATVSLTSILNGLHTAINYEKALRASLESQHQELEETNLRLKKEMAERKIIGKELIKKDQKLHLLAENALDCIWMMNTDLEFTFVNPAVETLFGYTPEEWKGSSLGDHCPACDHDTLNNHFKSVVTNQDHIGEGVLFETHIIHKDGSLIPVEVLFRSVVDKNGHVAGLQGNTRDIRERKASEKKRLELETRIHQAQKLEAIGTLAGGIAHDFNNILSSIIGYTELAIDETEETGVLKKYLNGIFSASRRARALVNQILTFSSQDTPEMIPVQPGRIAKETIKLLQPSLPSGIEIKCNINTSAYVMGDPTQFHQVIMNLCKNGVQAMEQKGGCLTIEINDHTVDEQEKESEPVQKQYLKLTVTDQGGGIPEKIKGLIFEPYFTTKDQGAGTGLGLSVVHGIIKKYNGEIFVSSDPRAGTRFSIILPAKTSLKDTLENPPPLLPKGSENILVVDDESDVVTMISLTLEKLGYTVFGMESSTKAYEVFSEKPNDIDLVISDITMPELTGDKLAVELMKIKPELPVILCTGYNKSISEETARELGVKSLAQKPLIKSELATLVRTVLDDIRN